MSDQASCFTAYDIRGKVPEQLNEKLAARIGAAYVEETGARKIVVGYDMRLTSKALASALISSLTEQGSEVIDIGLCGTEEVYYKVFSGINEGVDGGIMITASHNPAEYNGMKLVGRGAQPVAGASGLNAIKARINDARWIARYEKKKVNSAGTHVRLDKKQPYIDHLLSYVDPEKMQPFTIVVNPGNGCAGPIIDLLEPHLPFTFIKIYDQPDGSFPNGVPNPLLPEKRVATAEMVQQAEADMGVAWDGDFDRCFLYDEQGRFIEGVYIVALLAAAILRRHPGALILHDPRSIWNTIETVRAAGGKPIMTRTGHALIKEKMRECDAVYGGEMSAHHYFRSFGYCDSGMIPWLLVTQLISSRQQPLSTLVDDMMRAFPVSGEINSSVHDPDEVIRLLEEKYQQGEIDRTDGLSVSFADYRFNVRKSNTEPLLRLNVETRGDKALLRSKTEEILKVIRNNLR
ncbi:MAG: phosphomannomutase [Desulfobulbus propionicus]|nr:MAG: phosphomannomutase [Desulfobulbus propionicus]